MENSKYDVLIIGAGPGGIEAAIQASKFNLKTALISATKIGGRATWSSLIPSKVWLATAAKMDALKHLEVFGIKNRDTSIDLDLLRKRIKEQSSTASQGYIQQFKKADIDVFYGNGKIKGTTKVEVSDDEGNTKILETKNILIATGSGPRFFPELKPNKDHIIAPKLSPILPKIPKSMVMAGGGVTGTEYAYAFAALGSSVTILQKQDQLLPRLDPEISEIFEQYLEEQYDITIKKGLSVKSMKQEGGRIIAQTSDGATHEAEYGFIATGRKADLSFYNPEEVTLNKDDDNTLKINKFCQTNKSNIYAIGDVTGFPMTANRATLQARIAITHLAKGISNSFRIPHFIEAIYTNPEVGQIGDISEDDSSYFVRKSFNALVKANILDEAKGLLKIKVDKQSGLIKGAAGFGAHVNDLLAVIQVAMNNDLSYEQIQHVPLAHPTMSELISME